MRAQPEQQAPPVQRLRVHYAKRGRLRFASHRDFSRAFERALLRARVPMAYSSGFNPHPRISYAGAAPTGAASEAEYVEIGLREICDPQAIAHSLDQALPPGLDVVDVVAAPVGASSLSDRMEASHWRLRLATSADAARKAVDVFLAQETVQVSRMTKKGLREFDCRGAVVALSAVEEQGCAILDLVLRHGTPSVRPDDILVALEKLAGLAGDVPALAQRVSQGPLDLESGRVGDPLAVDRDAS